MSLTRTLPGVFFEASTRAPADVLPRMDVAGFAGFAASGPIGVPVAIEDIGRFHELFGEDLPLAWDNDRGEVRNAQLAPAVRAFFRGGGVRCWVVRVAGAAVTNQVSVPGVLVPGPAGRLDGAWLQARSAGSWSDAWTLNVTSLATPREIRARLDAQHGFALEPAAAGDVIAVVFEGSSVVAFQPAGTDARTSGGEWFERAAPGTPLPALTLVEHLRRPCPRALDVLESRAGTAALELRVERAQADAIHAGDWLRLTPGTASPRGSALFFLVEQLAGAAETSATGAETVWIDSSQLWWRMNADEAWARTAALAPQASTVRLELWAGRASGRTLRLENVSLEPGNAQYLGLLPGDSDLATLPASGWSDLVRSASTPRFPWAAVMREARYFPLGVSGVLHGEWFRPPFPQPGPPLERDGLGSFEVRAFLDPDLAGNGVDTLPEAAFHKQHQRRTPEQLQGLHALWPVEEISLLSVPDAGHRAWQRVDPASALIPPPALDPLTISGETLRAHWSAVPHAAAYLMQEAADALFETVTRTWTLTETTLDAPYQSDACRPPSYFRVHARRADGDSPWSNTERTPPSVEDFHQCAERGSAIQVHLQEPDLSASARLVVRWSIPEGVDRFILEASSEPLFTDAATLYDGPRDRFELAAPASGLTLFRVRGLAAGETGPWSNTVAFERLLEASFEFEGSARDGHEPEEALGRLQRLHEAMCIFCAARGDTFAVLGLPEHFRERTTLEYRRRLARAGPLSDPRALSFAALYHPWTLVREGAAQQLRSIAPDGTICGQMAARTLRGGAWLAAANRPLPGVLALSPRGLESSAEAFFAARINRLEQRPEGFVVLDWETLSEDTELRAIGVRRLLILLRRLALREGNILAFEPNDRALQRRAQTVFQQLLGLMFTRGAFAGARPEHAFRVICGGEVNRPQSVEQGRFIVELRVAPAEPLMFLTVRLVQLGNGILIAQEGAAV